MTLAAMRSRRFLLGQAQVGSARQLASLLDQLPEIVKGLKRSCLDFGSEVPLAKARVR